VPSPDEQNAPHQPMELGHPRSSEGQSGFGWSGRLQTVSDDRPPHGVNILIRHKVGKEVWQSPHRRNSRVSRQAVRRSASLSLGPYPERGGSLALSSGHRCDRLCRFVITERQRASHNARRLCGLNQNCRPDLRPPDFHGSPDASLSRSVQPYRCGFAF
jgi:hypothetical protein